MKTKNKIIFGTVLITLFVALFSVNVTAITYPACCCWEDRVSVVTEDTARTCGMNGGNLVSGPVSTDSECITKCGIANVCTNCQSGLCTDSDYQDCSSNPSGGVCPSGYSCCTGSCTMRQAPGQGCENPTLNIKPTNLARGDDKGHKQITVAWDDSFDCPVISYDILRCTGNSCTPTASIGSTSQKSYTDTSVSWGTYYRYIIKGNYQYQGAKSSDIITIFTGDSECENHVTDALFCSNGQKAQCNSNNIITKTACSSGQICVSGNCISPSNCHDFSGNPFGEYYTQQNCEGTSLDYKYCFLDKSKTNVDMCYSCGGEGMKCYDYKSKQACEKDNCNVGTNKNPTSCQWRAIYPELGVGVCIDTEADNCGYCKSKGSTTMNSINSYAYNDVFDAYTYTKLEALSTTKYPCFENGNTCVSCGDVGCPIYKTQDECSQLGGTPITLNGLNEFVTSSRVINSNHDTCNIGVCRWFNDQCKKDADGIDLADCGLGNSSECEKDYFRPNATVEALINSEGSATGFSITILDQTRINDTPIVKTDSGYNLYYCVVSNINNCIPRTYNNGFRKTNLKLLTVSNQSGILKLCAGQCNNNSITLKNGISTLKYYAEDPSSNIGLVQSLNFSASIETRPVPYAAYINEANYLEDGIYYKNIRNPIIQINFTSPSKLMDYSLKDSSGRNITLSYASNNYKQDHSIQTANLTDGTYTFSFNAESEVKRQMLSKKQIVFVLDTIVPRIIIEPNEPDVLNKSRVSINISLNEKSLLIFASINSEDKTTGFSSINNTMFVGAFDLKEGLFYINATARDYAGNYIKGLSNFEVNAVSNLNITLVRPKYGVSQTNTFNLEINTDNTAKCKYRIRQDNDGGTFDNSVDFSKTNSLVHTNQITLQQENLNYNLFIKCQDLLYKTITSKQYNISFDTTKPNFVEFTGADPESIATYPPETTLKITTDDQTICRYNSSISTGIFDGFNNPRINDFSITHSHDLGTENERLPLPNRSTSYTYSIWCMNLAELSNEATINFTIDKDAPIEITWLTKKEQINTSIPLVISVNVNTNCEYSNQSSAGWTALVKESTTKHKKTISVAKGGNYTYYARCWDSRINSYSPTEQRTLRVDLTPPIMIYVNDSSEESNPEFTWKNNMLRVKTLGEDNETRVSTYYYRLKKFGSDKDLVFNWTDAPRLTEEEWLSINQLPNGTQLNLTDKQKYQFDVKPENAYGLIGNPMSSNGITIDLLKKPSHCNNSLRDENETDIDCGDGCYGCNINQRCNSTIDCAFDLICVNKKCTNKTNESIRILCNDGIKNGEESDIDCGGNCSKCDNGLKCLNKDSNCKSGYCDISTGKCSAPDKCHNNALDPGETGIDCGGPCSPCSTNDFCDSNSDCQAGSKCINGVCKPDSDGDGIVDNQDNCPDEPNEDQSDIDQDGTGDACDDDIDGDGLKNNFETKYGLDPYNQDTDGNGIFDGDEDTDNDGLVNRREQDEGGSSFCLDPRRQDTDGDKYSDKDELDKITDPCDSNSYPKSNFWLWIIILFILLLIILSLVLFYPKYKPYLEKIKSKKTNKTTLATNNFGFFRKDAPSKIQSQNKSSISGPVFKTDSSMEELLEKKRKEKEEKRKGMFSAFGGFTQQKQEPMPKEYKTQSKEPAKETKIFESQKFSKKEEKVKDEPEEEWLHLSSLNKGKKEDIFGKLKDISKTQKDIFKKIENVSKPAVKETKIVPVIIKSNPIKKTQNVVSTETAKTYHKPGCITIKGKKNLVKYSSEEAARNKDLKKCDVCFPVKRKKDEKKK